jgi:NhaP-type Na+/H+ or K+/H+ antiporter
MSALQTAAVVLLVVAFLLTGLAGLMDMSYNQFQITRQHAWNDGIFLGIVAIFVLILDMKK